MKIKFFHLILPFLLLFGCQNAKDLILNTDDISPSADQINQASTTSSVPKAVDQEVLKQRIAEEERAAVDTKIKESKEEVIISNESPTTTAKDEMPTFFDLPVLFASQAPFANWDDLHEEACEEASMIMVDKYFKKETLSPHIMEQGILNLISWEEENGYLVDLTASESVYILDNYFKLNAETSFDVSIEKIKEYLLGGKLVIVPVAGRLLGNPNFTGQGPIYHMLVIRGFDDTKGEFITNEPGTRKGDGYRYKYDVLLNAIHDWSHKLSVDGMTDEEITSTQKVIIVVGR